MPTIKLTPSSYGVSNSTYVSVTNAANMYHDVSNTTYATFYNSRSSTTTYYGYIRGFDVSQIPENAVINSFAFRIRGYESGAVTSTGTSYDVCLVQGSSVLSGTHSAQNFGTSVKTITIPTGTIAWNVLAQYEDSLGIRICVRRSSSSTPAYVYIYGAEIEVDYTVPDPAVITSSLEGNGVIEPSGVYNTYVDRSYTLKITPTTWGETVTATKNGVDITSALVEHEGTGEDTLALAAESYTVGGTLSGGSSYAGYPVGHTAENPNTYSSNMYASSGSTAYVEYAFDFSNIPANATIESLSVKCNGKRESSTTDSTHMAKIELYTGSTVKSDDQQFTSTSTQTITISTPGTWTREELQNAKLRFTVAYYGGALYGITWTVTYSFTGDPYYTYTYTVDGDATILVKIGNVGGAKIYIKENGNWVQYSKIYKKINGNWVEQSDWTTIFDSQANYVKEN